jgi:NAD(P)H-nitrite reductase large subunit
MSHTIVVIGASAASISFIAKVRSQDSTSTIVCFSAEEEYPYNRCFLADVLTGKKTESDILLKPESWYKEHNVQLCLGRYVTDIVPDEKYIIVDGDEEVPYDILFVGTGSSAVQLPLAGLQDSLNVFNFHTLADIKNIQTFVDGFEQARALVIGGGINGIEAASALCELGCLVTIVEKQDRLMSSALDETCAQFVENRAQEHGVTIMPGVYVTKIVLDETDAMVQSVQLSNKKNIKVDLIVCAVGAKVNNELAVRAGFAMLQGGILVDEYMKTNKPDVYAGGDVCVAQDIVTKKKVRSASWPDAMLQGLTAATQLSQSPRSLQGIINSRDSHFFGIDFYSCGNTVGDDSIEIREETSTDFFHRLYIKDNKLHGFVLFGNIEQLAKYKQLYVTQKEI